MTEEYYWVVYNDCYGRFEVPNDNQITYERVDNKPLIEWVKQNGNSFGNGTFYAFARVPKEYKEYIKINDYDGLENVEIDFDKYLLNNIREVIDEYKKIYMYDREYVCNAFDDIYELMNDKLEWDKEKNTGFRLPRIPFEKKE